MIADMRGRLAQDSLETAREIHSLLYHFASRIRARRL
jgi:hypothetical protein